jgi:hypothetical protein
MILKNTSIKQVKEDSEIPCAKLSDPVLGINAFKKEIDQFVYELYRLTEEEISIVESDKN